MENRERPRRPTPEPGTSDSSRTLRFKLEEAASIPTARFWTAGKAKTLKEKNLSGIYIPGDCPMSCMWTDKRGARLGLRSKQERERKFSKVGEATGVETFWIWEQMS